MDNHRGPHVKICLVGFETQKEAVFPQKGVLWAIPDYSARDPHCPVAFISLKRFNLFKRTYDLQIETSPSILFG